MDCIEENNTLSFYIEDDAASACESVGNATLVKNPYIFFGKVSIESVINEYQCLHQSLIDPKMQEYMSKGFDDKCTQRNIYCTSSLPSSADKSLCLEITDEMINDTFTPVNSDNLSLSLTTDSEECLYHQPNHPFIDAEHYPSTDAFPALPSISLMSDERFEYQLIFNYTQTHTQIFLLCAFLKIYVHLYTYVHHRNTQQITCFRKADNTLVNRFPNRMQSLNVRVAYGNRTLGGIIDDCLQDIHERESYGSQTSSLFFEIASNRHGSQYLQKQIESACENLPKNEILSLFDKLEYILFEDIIKLSMDGYSNYVIQKYLDNVGMEKRHNFINHLIVKNGMNSNIIGFLAVDKSGCRVLQKLMDDENHVWFKNMQQTSFVNI